MWKLELERPVNSSGLLVASDRNTIPPAFSPEGIRQLVDENVLRSSALGMGPGSGGHTGCGSFCRLSRVCPPSSRPTPHLH